MIIILTIATLTVPVTIATSLYLHYGRTRKNTVIYLSILLLLSIPIYSVHSHLISVLAKNNICCECDEQKPNGIKQSED